MTAYGGRDLYTSQQSKARDLRLMRAGICLNIIIFAVVVILAVITLNKVENRNLRMKAVAPAAEDPSAEDASAEDASTEVASTEVASTAGRSAEVKLVEGRGAEGRAAICALLSVPFMCVRLSYSAGTLFSGSDSVLNPTSDDDTAVWLHLVMVIFMEYAIIFSVMAVALTARRAAHM